ncbi:MAG: hypothetical protein NT049_16430 [Planctomycetota bacterium]|nr:hypothetical protein [Planctomycetota bacterium]
MTHRFLHRPAAAALVVLLGLWPALAFAAEPAAPAAAPEGELLQAKRMLYEAARGPARIAAGAAYIDALLEAVQARTDAGAIPEAVALQQKALATAIVIKSDRRPEIEAQLKSLADQVRAIRAAEDLKKQVEAHPEDAALREKLARAYLVDLDNPAEAAKYIEDAADESLRRFVPAAAKGVEAAPELACIALGDWYRVLADAAAPRARPAMLTRAQGYYRRFLELHAADDLDRAKVLLCRQKVEEDLAKLPSAAKAAKWIDLLVTVDPARDTLTSKWKRVDQAISAAPATPAGIVVPVAVQGDYEVEMKFRRTSGDDMVGLTLPLATGHIVLNLGGYHGTSSGLEFVDGNRSPTNPTKAAIVLQNDRSYVALTKVIVRGQEAEISVKLDGKPVISYKGPLASLAMPKWFPVVPKAFCLLTWESAATFESLRLKMLSGDAKPLRP